jgi:ferredoxin-NADP reductase
LGTVWRLPPTTLALQALGEDRYRISVKREPHGAAGAYIDTRVQAGDILDVSAPRGSFTLRWGGI